MTTNLSDLLTRYENTTYRILDQQMESFMKLKDGLGQRIAASYWKYPDNTIVRLGLSLEIVPIASTEDQKLLTQTGVESTDSSSAT